MLSPQDPGVEHIAGSLAGPDGADHSSCAPSPAAREGVLLRDLGALPPEDAGWVLVDLGQQLVQPGRRLDHLVHH
jgi:hypothetical protein